MPASMGGRAITVNVHAVTDYNLQPSVTSGENFEEITMVDTDQKCECGNITLPHALQEAKTLTSFARPPHDLLHTFPRQPALVGSTSLSLLVPPPSQST